MSTPPTPFVNKMEVLPINVLDGPEVGPLGGGVYAFTAPSIGSSAIKLQIKNPLGNYVEAGDIFTASGGWCQVRIPADSTIKLTQTASNAIPVHLFVAESLHRR